MFFGKDSYERNRYSRQTWKKQELGNELKARHCEEAETLIKAEHNRRRNLPIRPKDSLGTN